MKKEFTRTAAALLLTTSLAACSSNTTRFSDTGPGAIVDPVVEPMSGPHSGPRGTAVLAADIAPQPRVIPAPRGVEAAPRGVTVAQQCQPRIVPGERMRGTTCGPVDGRNVWHDYYTQRVLQPDCTVAIEKVITRTYPGRIAGPFCGLAGGLHNGLQNLDGALPGPRRYSVPTWGR